MDDQTTTAQRWNEVYRRKPADSVSWYAPQLRTSLALLDAAGLAATSAVIDIGGGASTLVDDLLARGCGDVCVLDVSAAALDVARARLGERAAQVRWLVADATAVPLADATLELWHDRAVLHFLTDPAAAAAYAGQARRLLRAGGQAVIGGFAPDGPERCSGQVVARRSVDRLLALFGADFELRETRDELHTTPAGTAQKFLWLRLQRR